MLSVALAVITVLSFGLAIWQYARAESLNRRQRDLDWPRFRNAASDLAREVDRSEFMPDFILATSDRGAIVGHLVARELRRQIPILTAGHLDIPGGSPIPGFDAIGGTKTTVYIPHGVRDLTQKKVLVLDDFVMSGDGMAITRKQLESYGFAREDIKTGSVVVTKLAIANRKGPDFRAREIKDFDFFFPWGRAQ
jgi:hypoxanthine phosphoribosyltransferase